MIQGEETDREGGFSLIELMVYSLLLIIVISVVGGILINSLTVSRDVRSNTQAATLGQLVATSVDTGIRQASWISLTNTGSNQFLTARTTTGGATIGWQCQAWYFNASGTGSLYTKTSTTAIAAPGSTTGWTLLGTGIAAPSGGKVFTTSGKGIQLQLQLAVGSGRPAILIQSTTQSRQSATESAPCV